MPARAPSAPARPAEPRGTDAVASGRFATSLNSIRFWIERCLKVWVMFLISALTVIVVLAVIWRKAGASFVWYDEVGSIMLAWITYYGAALAALKRAHIGFDGILLSLPLKWRYGAAAIGEVIVFGFFILLAWAGWQVLQVLQGMKLISLPYVPIQFTQSVIPIGAVLFIICEALSLPEYWQRLRESVPADVAEVEEQMHIHERTKA
jgi:TRAP-type C4-dicarboxylate transport system permease small subunit